MARRENFGITYGPIRTASATWGGAARPRALGAVRRRRVVGRRCHRSGAVAALAYDLVAPRAVLGEQREPLRDVAPPRPRHRDRRGPPGGGQHAHSNDLL